MADRELAPIGGRRFVFGALTLSTIALFMAAMTSLLAADGLGPVDLALLGCFLLMLPWGVLNFWNALIGAFLVLSSRRAADRLLPPPPAGLALRGQTALALPIFEEDPLRLRAHVQVMRDSLAALPQADRFAIHILSDTQDPELVAEEARTLAAFEPGAVAVTYRRRPSNERAKQGNLAAFLDEAGQHVDYMLVLDADSLMTGAAIHDLVRRMDADPGLGILQTLVVGLPSESAFARLFQYGMRQGMHMFALGAAWWQGRTGCYWGHNAIIRLAPFKASCRLPLLPGKPPFGGLILSHDQAEAALMRRAGYGVCVLPLEAGSFEANPPTLPDFLKRDLRWCQGNMQYGRLLFWPGLTWMSRLQLLLAMLMYLQAAAWTGFLLVSLGHSVFVKALALPVAPGSGPSQLGLILYLSAMAMALTPKTAGLLVTLLRPATRRAFGGGRAILLSGGCEFLFSLLLMPVLAARQTLFIAGLFFGRARIWSSQQRDARAVGWGEAWRNLGSVALLGFLVTAAAAWSAPGTLPWLSPVVLPLMLAPVLAWASALPSVGAWLARHQIAATPEELAPPLEVAAVRPPSWPAVSVRPQRLWSDRLA